MKNTAFIEMRKKLNLTQVQMAEKLQTSQGTISDIEIGRIDVSKKIASKIEMVFQIKVASRWANKTSEIATSSYNYCPHCGYSLQAKTSDWNYCPKCSHAIQ